MNDSTVFIKYWKKLFVLGAGCWPPSLTLYAEALAEA